MGNKAHIIYIGAGIQEGGGGSGGSSLSKRVIDKDSVITADDDFILCAHSAPIRVTLAASCLGKIGPIFIKDISGNASQNVVTIVGENSEPIDESEELRIEHDFMGYEIISSLADYHIK